MEISGTVTTFSLIYVRMEIKARVQVNIMLMKQTRQYIPNLSRGLSTFTNYPSIVYVMHLKFVSHYKMCIVTSVWTGLP